MKQLFYSFLLLVMAACSHNYLDNEQRQNRRSNVVNVHNNIHVYEPEYDIMASSSSFLRIKGKYLLVIDPRPIDKIIHIFDKNSQLYIGSTGDLGQGPGEVSNLGAIAIDQGKNLLYVTDLGSETILSYNIDSVKVNRNYLPQAKAKTDNLLFPIHYYYVSDTLAFGVMGKRPSSEKSLVQSAGKWNMETNEAIFHEHEYPGLKAFRVSYAYSQEQHLLVECNMRYDLINVFDDNLNLKYRVLGPKWDERGDHKSHFGEAVIYKNWIIALYDGNDFDRHLYPRKCHVFNLEGNYHKTLDIGLDVWRMSLDEDIGRLYFTFQDEIQFGYLDLDDVL